MGNIIYKRKQTITGGGAATFSPLDLTNLHFYIEADKSAKYYTNSGQKLLLADLSKTKCAIKLSGSQPAYVTNQINGKGIIRFSNPNGNNGQYLDMDSFATGTNGFTIFCVVKFNSSYAEQPIFSHFTTSETNGGATLVCVNGYSTWVNAFDIAANNGTNSRFLAYQNNTKANSTWYTVIASYSNANAYIEVNNIPLTLSFTTGSVNSGVPINSTVPARIGAYTATDIDFHSDMDLACLGYCSSPVTGTNLTNLRNYLKTQWNTF